MISYPNFSHCILLFWLLSGAAGAVAPDSLLSTAGEGQSSQPTQQAQPEQPHTPTDTVPSVEEAVGLAEENIALAKSLLLSIKKDDALQFGHKIQELGASEQELFELFQAKQAGTLALYQLKEVRDRWLSFGIKVQDLKNKLDQSLQPVEVMSQSLTEAKKYWDKIQKESKKDPAYAYLERYHDKATEKIAEALAASEVSLDGYRRLEAKLVPIEAMINDEVGELNSRIEESKVNLLSLNERPVWQLQFSKIQAPDWSVIWKENLALFNNYIAGKTYQIFGVLFVGFFTLLVCLRWRFLMRQQQTTISLEALRLPILDYPLSSAITVMSLLSLWMMKFAPMLVLLINLGLFSLPVLRFTSYAIGNTFKPVAWALVIFFLLDVFRLVVNEQAISRIMLLFELVILIAVFIVTYGRVSKSNLKEKVKWMWKLYLFVAGMAFVVSFFANLIGASSIADLLFKKALTASYIGMAVIVISGVLETLYQLLCNAPVAAHFNIIKTQRVRMIERGWLFIRFLALVFWVAATLQIFDVGGRVYKFVAALVKEPLALGELSISLSGIITMGLVIWVSVYLSRLARIIFEKEIVPRSNFRRGVPPVIRSFLHYSIVLIGFLIGIGTLGIDFTKIAVILGALSVGIGIGLQNVVNNFVSGLILLLERPVTVGDVVELEEGGLTGEVQNIGIRASVVRTYSGSEVIVPNSQLISEQVINLTLSTPQQRVHIPVRVAYGEDVPQVIEILLETGREDDRVLDYPEPAALFLEMGESALGFELRVWVPRYDLTVATRSDLIINIYKKFRNAGIAIPFPQRVLHFGSTGDDLDTALPGHNCAPPDPATDN